MLGLVFVAVTFAQPVFASFSDINKDSISYMYSQQVIDGYADGTFRPLNNINRAELIKLLMSGADLPADAALNNCFKDVTGDAWYVSWVCTAKQKGWVGGYSDGTFQPEKFVNKAEAAKIISGVLAPAVNEVVLHRFNDVGEKSWFFPYVNSLSGNYYINWDRNFLPAALINRGEVAEIVFRDILAKKLYEPLMAQGVLKQELPSVKISEAESLALAARDFFRVEKIIGAATYDQLVAAQGVVDAAYQRAQKTYTGNYPDAEQWNYKLMLEDGANTYGVLSVEDSGREMPMVWRSAACTWAVVKFDTASKKLLAFDFFTRWVDRPSLVPNIVSVNNDVVELAIGSAGPDPALMYKHGDKVTFMLRNFR